MENYIFQVAVQHDWFDYAATAVSLLMSFVAVWIAISTARKQNKINLFKERADLYYYLFSYLHTWSVVFENTSGPITISNAVSMLGSYYELRWVSGFLHSNSTMQSFNSDYTHESQIMLYDLTTLRRVFLLFKIGKKDRKYVNELQAKGAAFTSLATALRLGKSKDDPDIIKLSQMVIDFDSILLKNRDDFLKHLEAQLSVI